MAWPALMSYSIKRGLSFFRGTPRRRPRLPEHRKTRVLVECASRFPAVIVDRFLPVLTSLPTGAIVFSGNLPAPTALQSRMLSRETEFFSGFAACKPKFRKNFASGRAESLSCPIGGPGHHPKKCQLLRTSHKTGGRVTPRDGSERTTPIAQTGWAGSREKKGVVISRHLL